LPAYTQLLIKQF